MTATDELRRMLDERGVEYTLDHGYREFFWDFEESGRARASAVGTKGLVQMIVTGITPEQAIEATLGKGECKVVKGTGHGSTAGTKASCSMCGGVMNARDRYCRWCGRKVMQ